MREEHGGGIPFPYLERMNIKLAVNAIYVEQDLSRFPYAGDRVVGMRASDKGELRDGVQLVEEWAGYAKKIAHHHVRMPAFQEIAQAVKHIEGFFALPLNDVVDFHGENFKAL